MLYKEIIEYLRNNLCEAIKFINPNIKLYWYQKFMLNNQNCSWQFSNRSRKGLSSGKLTKEDFKKIIEHFEKLDTEPHHLFITRAYGQGLKYYFDTIIIAKYSGYFKLQGPDGKTWFKKLNINDHQYYGSGNKAKRRLGYQYYEDGYDNFWSKTGDHYDQCDW